MSQTKIQAALELAVKGMPGLVEPSNITSSVAGNVAVFVTDGPHSLQSGVSVSIDGHMGCSPAVNGDYRIVVIDDSRFSLRDIGTDTPVSLSIGGIGGVMSANLTEWDNVSFTPVIGIPYQSVHTIFGKPQNPTYDNLVREIGFMQITLKYPKQVGTADIGARSEMIRNTFKRNATFEFDGVKVQVTETPERLNGTPTDKAYMIAIRIPFKSDTFS